MSKLLLYAILPSEVIIESLKSSTIYGSGFANQDSLALTSSSLLIVKFHLISSPVDKKGPFAPDPFHAFFDNDSNGGSSFPILDEVKALQSPSNW